ncbi:MAG TPA: prepilin-type N-terminal cleavage/methylation domain-containing protein [Patescibacteria group bacterium]|nr:prepilin-type N-terminal cleavage/methylation domain-containing protein [Patescibacteria group bacterium]
MKKGFTLLELIVVIIILGVLAILGFTQYARMIEKSRGAEAKAILGDIRKLSAGYYLEFGSTASFGTGASTAHIGTNADQIPSACRASHWFSYSVTSAATNVTGVATRCTAGGKLPQASTAGDVQLTSVLSTGVDTWGGSGGY